MIELLIVGCLAIFATIAVLAKMQRDGLEEERKNLSNTDFTVRFSKAAFWVGFLSVLLGIASLILMFRVDGIYKLYALLLMVIFPLAGVRQMIRARVFRVIVEGECITVLSPFQKPYSFTFQEIESVSCKVRSIVPHAEELVVRTTDGKKFTLESVQIGYSKFRKRIQEKVDRKRLSKH